jgi:pimeloyl-ACP methyl ester carboxylesterase
MLLNVACAERTLRRVEVRLRLLAERAERRVAVIGQSRGGELARVLAVRRPELVSKLVMLGSPVLDPLDVGPLVLGSLRSVARLGDLGIAGVFSSACGDGACCATLRGSS